MSFPTLLEAAEAEGGDPPRTSVGILIALFCAFWLGIPIGVNLSILWQYLFCI